MMKRRNKILLSFWSAKKVCSNDDTISDEDENLFETESYSDNVSEADEDVLQTSEQSSSRQVYKIIASSSKHTLSLQFN